MYLKSVVRARRNELIYCSEMTVIFFFFRLIALRLRRAPAVNWCNGDTLSIQTGILLFKFVR